MLRSLPQTCPVALRQFNFVASLFVALVGKRVAGTTERITRTDILRALNMQESEETLDKYAKDCIETLSLLEQYGDGGSRENAKVVAMASSEAPPAPPNNEKPATNLLYLLRETDHLWRIEQREKKKSTSRPHETVITL
ncbi:hypothetical protein CYLTODRAFT_45771 [Cylindrobasidium torrendii FP15055 ss-10]|uniref:Uncharacterized protein n=1 Tax=Cylindrobasidium torrendii FP15055 ss-10 TaxID=1314674 RepID=A0A0D7BPK1_9AGAR|nr:hypothetical protein CYLTODRAFT_45771 [Cylindrobasidium torrendii FP15055 ss-10]